MRRLLSSSLVLLGLLALALPVHAAVEVGDEAPDFVFEDSWNLPANKRSLEDLRGQVVLLEAFATW